MEQQKISHHGGNSFNDHQFAPVSEHETRGHRCGYFCMQLIPKIKEEFFFARKMLQYRYGPRGWYRYIKNKFFPVFLIRRVKPISLPINCDFEWHILSHKIGLWMTYWTIRSFMQESGLVPHVIVHDDGTIDPPTADMFESKFANVTVLRRAQADKQFAKLDVPAIIKKARQSKNFYILMFLDHFFLSASRRVMVSDNDILFFGRPTEIIDFMAGKSDVDAMYCGGWDDGRNTLPVDEIYTKKYAEILDHAARLNSGLMIFEKSKIPVERIAEYFEHATDLNHHLIEQSGWGMILSQVSHAFFPEATYRLRGGFEKGVIFNLFTNPRRHEFFAYGIDEVRKRMRA